MNIFISHSSTEFKVAEEVCNLLEEKGHKCFLAPRDIRSGYEYAEEIMNGIESSDIMLILMSQAANQSPHVLREVERAVSKHIPLIVYKLEEVELSKSMEYFLMSHQWVSAYAGATHAQVVRCINQFEKERDELSVQIEDIKKKGNHFLAVFGIALLLVTILLVGAVYLKSVLNKKAAEEREEASVKQEQIDEKDDLDEEQAEGTVEPEKNDTEPELESIPAVGESVTGFRPITASPAPKLNPSNTEAVMPSGSSVVWFGCRRQDRVPGKPMVVLQWAVTGILLAA